jgi:hypothetical protein
MEAQLRRYRFSACGREIEMMRERERKRKMTWFRATHVRLRCQRGANAPG